jgi:catechol 2,3-dioxygenase-like lactoylglutathione lyase family enzyme
MADPVLFILEPVATPPPDDLSMGIEHIGWGSHDPVEWFAEASALGVTVDGRPGAPPMPVPLAPNFYFVYLRGPDAERIEVFSDPVEEFNHVHFMTRDVDATVGWYEALLGIEAELPAARQTVAFSLNTIFVDGVRMIFFGPPYPFLPENYVPTDDRPIGHVAFSVTDLGAMRDRVEELGVEVVDEPTLSKYGFRSFFVRAPESVLIEFVEAGAPDEQG